jgi:hypothetical protein
MQAAPFCVHSLKYGRRPYLLRNLISFPLSCSLRHGIQFTLDVNWPLPNAVAIPMWSAQPNGDAWDRTAYLNNIEGVLAGDYITK